MSSKIQEVDLGDKISERFLGYARHVNISRAIPDARDGLKPVQRRILYAMYKNGLLPSRPHKKSARIVGETMGKYHPHGDASIYDALVKLAEPHGNNLALIDPQGNFGSPDDSPAASRYTECRLSESGVLMLDGIEEDACDWDETYDGESVEPVFLPAGVPYLLVNGASGIGVGTATNLLSYNPRELSKVLSAIAEKMKISGDFVKNLFGKEGSEILEIPIEKLEKVKFKSPAVPKPSKSEKLTGKQIRSIMPAADFVSAAEISGDFEKIYETGEGEAVMHAVTSVISEKGKKVIEITELPYRVGPEKILEQIDKLIADGNLDGVSGRKNMSSRKNPVKLHVVCKRGVNPQRILDILNRKTSLTTALYVNQTVVSGGKLETLSMFDLCRCYLYHRAEVALRRAFHVRYKALLRIEILEGYLAAMEYADEIIRIIRTNPYTKAVKAIEELLPCTKRQAEAILELRLRRFTALEVKKISDEKTKLTRKVKECDRLITSPFARRKAVVEDVQAFGEKFGYPRRTSLKKR